MPRNRITRRRVLTLAGGAVLGSLAGCTESNQSDRTPGDTSSPTAQPTPSPTPAEAARTAEPTPTDVTPTSTTEATETPGAAGGAPAGTSTVDMITDNKGSYFDPKGVLIEPGETIQFVNESGSHSATAYHPDNGDQPLRIPKTATPWDSGVFTEQGKTFEVTFEEQGVYDYYCTPHEMMGMVGRIVVGEPKGGPGTTPPTELPPGAKEALPAIKTILDKETVAGP